MKHIYNKDHQEGIHDVTGATERVIVDQAWSIEIPDGFSYCADTSMTVCDVNGYNYMLQIQKTEDADFNEAYGSEVSLSVYGQFGAINHYNLDALEIEDHLMGMLSVNPDSKIVKYSKDIFVAYYSLYGVTYCFQVYAAGKNRIYTGQITCADDISAEECRQYLESFLDTIEPVTVAELAEADTLVALDDSYLPDFEDCRYIEFGDNLRIPVPNGFDSRIDLDANPCLVIAPEDFDFTESPLKAKITFCISDFSEVPEAFDRQKSMGFINTFMDFLNVSAKTTLFHRANGIYTTRADEKGIILNSYVTNNDCTISQSPTLIFTGKESFYCYVLLSYDLPIADDHDTQWDVRQITTSWLSRIKFISDDQDDLNANERKAPRRLLNVVRDSEYTGFGEGYNPVCPQCGMKSMNTLVSFGGNVSTELRCRYCGKSYPVRISAKNDDIDGGDWNSSFETVDDESVTLSDTESANKKGQSKGKNNELHVTEKANTQGIKDSMATCIKVSVDDCGIDFDGVLFSYNGADAAIILPDEIISIGEDAFYRDDTLSAVVIPEGVQTIEDSAFLYCENLKSVVLPRTLLKIGNKAFYGTALTDIVIPEDCREIGADCFRFCLDLRNIYVPASVCDIGTDAFKTLNHRTTIHTPKGSAAEAYAIENELNFDNNILQVWNSGIESVDDEPVPLPDTEPAKKKVRSKTKTSQAGVPKGKNAKIHVIERAAPSEYRERRFSRIRILGSAKKIGESSFYGCTKLKEVTIEEGIEEIGEGAFCECGIESIRIPCSVKRIGKNAFYHCKELKEVIIEEGLEEIGDGAFDGCHNLLFVTLPETLKKIGDYAFSFFIGGGTGQKYRINFVAVPESVEDISESFFDYSSCPSKRVASKGSKFEEITRDSKYKYENYPCRRGLLMSTKARPDFDPYAYISCGEPVPTSAQNENTSAEENGERKEIVDLVIPARKKIIQKNAYENCETLKTITLSKSLERIEESAFRNCPAISEIVFGDKLSYIGARAFQTTEKKGYLKTLTIPGSVKHIGDQAFDGFVIEELILLEGIESIGENAFSGFAGAVELPVSLSNYSKNAFGPNAFLPNNPTLKKKLNESKAVMEEKRVTQQKNNAFLFGERRMLTQTEQNYEEEMERLESLKKKKEEVIADRESFISNAGLTEKRIIKQIECTRNVIEVYKDQLAHLSVFAFSQKKEISARIQKEEEILRNTINELDAHREKTASDMNSFLKRNEEIEEEMRECIEKCDGLSKGIKGLEASIKAFEASEKEFTDLVDSIAAQEKLISMNMDTLRIRNDSYKKGLAK